MALAIALIVIFLPLTYVATKVYEEMIMAMKQFSSADLNTSIDNMYVYVNNLGLPFTKEIISNISYSKESIIQMLNGAAPDVAGKTVEAAKGTISGIFQLFLCLVTAFFIIVESKSIKEFAYKISPLGKKDMDILTTKASETLYATLFGVIVISIVQSILAGIGLYFAGLSHVLFLTALMMITGTIPFVGTPVVWFPAVVYLFMSGSIVKAILLFLWGALFVGTIDNILRPMIVGSRTSLHPMLVFFSIIGGIILLGPVGIFAGPVILVIALCLIDIATNPDAGNN